MAKDPAFLFYSSDFLTGTMMMTDTEVGQYIRLLCYQHQAGHFDATAMQRLCGGNATASLAAKFKIDSDGLYYNERLEEEVIKRKKHSEKQRDNANKRWQSNGNATAMPLEDENENENESVIDNDTVIKKESEKEKKAEPKKFNPINHIPSKWNEDLFMAEWDEFMQMRKRRKWSCSDKVLISRIKQLSELSGYDWGVASAIMQRSTERGYAEFFALTTNVSTNSKQIHREKQLEDFKPFGQL